MVREPFSLEMLGQRAKQLGLSCPIALDAPDGSPAPMGATLSDYGSSPVVIDQKGRVAYAGDSPLK